MPMKVRELIQLLERNGWKEMRSKGSHRHFKNANRASLVTVPGNDGKELAAGTLNAILKKAGLNEREALSHRDRANVNGFLRVLSRRAGMRVSRRHRGRDS